YGTAAGAEVAGTGSAAALAGAVLGAVRAGRPTHEDAVEDGRVKVEVHVHGPAETLRARHHGGPSPQCLAMGDRTSNLTRCARPFEGRMSPGQQTSGRLSSITCTLLSRLNV